MNTQDLYRHKKTFKNSVPDSALALIEKELSLTYRCPGSLSTLPDRAEVPQPCEIAGHLNNFEIANISDSRKIICQMDIKRKKR